MPSTVSTRGPALLRWTRWLPTRWARRVALRATPAPAVPVDAALRPDLGPDLATPSDAVRAQAHQIDRASHGLGWVWDRLDPRRRCQNSRVLGLEHRGRLGADGHTVVYAALPPGRETLLTRLLAQLDPPSADDRRETLVVPWQEALARTDGATVLPCLVWATPDGAVHARIAGPATDDDAAAELVARLRPWLTEQPAAWPWHRQA